MGQRLRAARRKAGFTIVDAAKAAGMSVNTLGGSERDERSLRIENASAVARLYHVSLDWLVHGEQDDGQ